MGQLGIFLSSLECEKQRAMDLWDPSTEMHSVKVFGWVAMAVAIEHYCFAFRLKAAFFPLIASFLTTILSQFWLFGVVYSTTHEI
jgi:hypothetical protein